jgi:hypothetical protein
MFLMQDKRQSKFLLHRIIERQMEEQDNLINVQEEVNRQEYTSCISCATVKCQN